MLVLLVLYGVGGGVVGGGGGVVVVGGGVGWKKSYTS